MKILLAAPFGLKPKGTVSARILPLAEALKGSGHDATILVPPYDDPSNSGKVIRRFGVRIEHIVLPREGKGPIFHLKIWRSLLNRMLKSRADIIHVFKPKGHGGLAAWYLSLQRMTFRSWANLVLDMDDYEGFGGWNDRIGYPFAAKVLFEAQERTIPHVSSATTVVSRELRSILRQRGLPNERVFYVPNGIRVNSPDSVREAQVEALKEYLELDGGQVILLYTRFHEFTPKKLVRIVERVVQRLPGIHFVIVGKGRFGEESKIRALTTERGLASVLRWAGWIPPQKLPLFFSLADVAVYPMDNTLINRCKCPAKLVELLAWGIPTVAERVGETQTYIESGRSGILVTEGNTDAFAEGVARLLQNHETAKRMGKEARHRIRTDFAWPNLVTRVEQAYRRALDA